MATAPPFTTVNPEMPSIGTMLARRADVVDAAIKAVPPATIPEGSTPIQLLGQTPIVFLSIAHHICIPLG